MTTAARTTVCFEKPVFILLDKDKEVVNPVTDFVGGQEGHIRTRSMRDYFSNHDVRVKYAISRNATNSEIREYLDRNFVHGYGEGAVVARRWTAGLRFLYPHQWGVIMHTHPSAGLQQDWGPYQIRWFDSAAYENSWAEDLLIIHAALDRSIIVDIVEDQGFDVTEARNALQMEKP